MKPHSLACAVVLVVAACNSFSGSDVSSSGALADGGAPDDGGAGRVEAGPGPDGGDSDAGGDGRDVVVATNEHTVYAIAVDSDSLFWAQNTSGLIRRSPLAGGNVTTFCATKAAPVALALGPSVLFYTAAGSDFITGAATDQTTCTPIASVKYVAPHALAMGKNKLYFVETVGPDGSGVAAVPVNGTGLGTIPARAADTAGRPIDIVSDGTSAYWLDTTTCDIRMLDEGGGGAIPISGGGTDCRGLAVAAGKLYWTSHQDGTIYTTSVVPASVVTPYVTGEQGLGPIVADAAGVYWLDTQSGTLRTKGASGTAFNVAHGDDQTGAPLRFHGLALSADYVFRVSYAKGDIKRWRRAP